MRVHGFAPREGELVFAFCAMRLAAPADRARLIELARGLAELTPDADAAAAAIPEDPEPGLRMFSLPWRPPEGDAELAAQRAVIERAGELGIEALWFAQTGTQLPQTRQLRCPVDNYPEILERYDWEDFGVACKLGGPWLAGAAAVIVGLHALWLAPYGGRYRNTAVTIDQRHRAVHFWVDRFTAPSEARELVHHLLWIVGQLDEIFPVLHARFEGASMAEKYGGMVGDAREPFVLGGNPLRTVHALGGEAGIDTWIEAQTSWANDEIATMLRELALDAISAPAEEPAEDVDAIFDAAFVVPNDDDDDDHDDDDDNDNDEAEDEAAPAPVGAPAGGDNHVARPGRYASLPSLASEVLAARATAGLLDPRVLEALAAIPARDAADPRLAGAARVLDAARDRPEPDDHDVN